MKTVLIVFVIIFKVFFEFDIYNHYNMSLSISGFGQNG